MQVGSVLETHDPYLSSRMTGNVQVLLLQQSNDPNGGMYESTLMTVSESFVFKIFFPLERKQVFSIL